jgi:tRNA(Ile)-lysidine synthetase-like protein
MQQLLGLLRKAIADYKMIESGDHVVVGLSGGKDSLTLLSCLAAYQKFSPEKFKLTAVTVDLGFKDVCPHQVEAMKAYCSNLGVEYIIEKTDIAEVIFDIRKEKNPCSLCSKMRRGVINTACKKIGANKLALGHHSEDLLETFLLSFMYEGRLNTFQPTSFMDRSGITLIRPFIYVSENDIAAFAKRNNLPIVFNPCPKNHFSQREYMKELVKSLQKDIPFAKERMFQAIIHSERYNLFPPIIKDTTTTHDARCTMHEDE